VGELVAMQWKWKSTLASGQSNHVYICSRLD
jgi:hypothetical protein